MTQYIDKSAVVAEIKKCFDEYTSSILKYYDAYKEAKAQELGKILTIIDTLEVKEVDYERELSKYVSNGIHRFFPNEGDDYYKMDSVTWQDYVIETARHFFEFGLKAQKGEGV